MRIRHIITFSVLLILEIIIGKWATGFIRGYVGDILVIPTVYFLLRAVIFAKDSIFAVYVLPFICYFLGWMAEVLQAMDITGILGIEKDSPPGILLGGSYDLRDGLAYLAGLYLTGILLMFIRDKSAENKDKSEGWYPLRVFIHWTWGYLQTIAGFFLYLAYIRYPHRYYHGVVRTAWDKNSALSMGMFIFTPFETAEDEGRQEYCEKVAVHEFGHTFQALLLGPLYPFIIGIPSLSWGNIPYFQKMRNEKNIPYTWLFCEKWASFWGEKALKEKAIWD